MTIIADTVSAMATILIFVHTLVVSIVHTLVVSSTITVVTILTAVAILAQGEMGGRAPGPKTVHFQPLELATSWRAFAQLRTPGFEFDGSGYGKPVRSLSGDLTGLVAYSAPLKCLLGVAPTGFPSQASVRDSLLLLQKDHNIFQCQPHMEEKRADEAADIWRVMCKDLYNIKKKQPTGKHTEKQPTEKQPTSAQYKEHITAIAEKIRKGDIVTVQREVLAIFS